LDKGNRDFVLDDMYKTGQKYIKEVRKKADLVVLLINADKKEKQILQNEFVDADYIVMSHDISRTRKGHPQPKDKPPVYNPGKQGKYLALLELEISDLDSNFVDISYYEKIRENSKRRLENFQRKDPKTPLKELYEDNQAVFRQIVNLENQLNEAELAINTALNMNKFDLIPMSQKIKDDKTMIAFVSQCLAKEKKLRGDTSIFPKDNHKHNHDHDHKHNHDHDHKHNHDHNHK